MCCAWSINLKVWSFCIATQFKLSPIWLDITIGALLLKSTLILQFDLSEVAFANEKSPDIRDGLIWIFYSRGLD